MHWLHWRILCTLVLPFLPLAHAIPTNRTIDDTFGDLITGAAPIYTPSPWQHSDCTGCAIHPPLVDVFLGTYSALTFWPEDFPVMSIQISFQGTAVYVYFILANFVATGVTTETLVNFTLDNQPSSIFHHVPTNSTDYQFNSLVYSIEGLPNANHSLRMSTSGVNRHLFTSFDYANYTFDDSDTVTPATSVSPSGLQPSSTATAGITVTPIPATSKSVPVAAIAGGTIGGIIMVLIAILIYLCLRRKKRVDAASYGESTEPTVIDGPSPGAPSQGPIWLPPSFGAFPSYIHPPTLPPPYSNSSIPGETESVQRMRQAEIDDQIQNLTQEIQALSEQETTVKERRIPSFRRPPRERGILHLEQQVETKRGEIEYLQAQLHSDWARGLSDDPPPSYSIGIPPRENGR